MLTRTIARSLRPLLSVRNRRLVHLEEVLMASRAPLVWIDCEMTGLDRQNDKIMSVCCFVTDADLNLLDDKGYEAVIHHDNSTLDRMGEWCRNTHGSSGLTAACLASSTSSEAAADGLLTYIKSYVPEPRNGLLAGNSVHADKDFLSQPPYAKVIDHLHYRILDVSSLKEAARRWASQEVLDRVPKKRELHQAREDVLESIEEARFYREIFFLPTYKPSKDQPRFADTPV